MATLSATGSLASLLDSVYPDKSVRDKARELTQTVAEAATALSLNQEVYRALAAIDMSCSRSRDHALRESDALNYRLAGVDKDDATRAHLRELSDKATELSLTFAKHVQENVNRVEVRDTAELDGLPEDYIRNHPPDAQGVITLTTDYPDMQPVMTFATNADLRLRMFRAYNTRAYPANRQLLLDLLSLRQEMASILGLCFLGRPGHCQSDDGLGGQHEEVHRRTGAGFAVLAPRGNTRWCWPLPANSSRD